MRSISAEKQNGWRFCGDVAQACGLSSVINIQSGSGFPPAIRSDGKARCKRAAEVPTAQGNHPSCVPLRQRSILTRTQFSAGVLFEDHKPP